MTRQECAATVLGGPTTVLDLGGLRIVSDPTFDDPGPHGYLTKTVGPAVTEDQLGPVDLVLISHDNHPDNLDDRGRALALAAPVVLTTDCGPVRVTFTSAAGLPALVTVPDTDPVGPFGAAGAAVVGRNVELFHQPQPCTMPTQDFCGIRAAVT